MIIFFSLYLLFYSFHVFATIQIIARLAAVVDSKPSAYIPAEVFLPASDKKSVKYNTKNNCVRSQVACIANRLYNSYIHMAKK